MRLIKTIILILCGSMIFTGCIFNPRKNSSADNSNLSSGTISAGNYTENIKLVGIKNHVAGSKGFVTVKDGHFYVGGERIRFFGVSIGTANCFPTKELADQMVDDLAKHGINCVRLHHMDFPSEDDVFKDFRNNTIELDEQKLERLDYFIYALEQKGIYININTHVSRQYAENDGMPEYQDVNFAGKYINYFDDKAKQLQKDYIEKLYSRVNKISGKKYTDDPGIAMIEMTNENWLYMGWTQGQLHPKANTGTDKSVWSIPDYYIKELDAKFNEWLKTKYKTTELLVNAWKDEMVGAEIFNDLGEYKGLGKTLVLEKSNIPRMKWISKDSYPKIVLEDNAEFYTTLEINFYKEMLAYMKNTIGIKVPITTTNGYFGNPSLYAQTLGDYTDTHFYIDTLGDKWHSFKMDNISVVKDNAISEGVNTAINSYIGAPSLSKVKGKPMTISEFNIPFPSKFEYECLPVMAAYALYQDWDGLFPFAYSGSLKEGEIGAMITLDSSLDLAPNPMKMSQIAMCAQMFIRGDIRPASEVITAQYGIQELYKMLNTKEPWAYNSGWTWSYDLNGAFPISALYKFRFEKEFIDGKTSIASQLFKPGEYEQLFIQDEHIGSNNELIWYAKEDKNYIRIDTPMTQGTIGFTGNKEIKTTDLDYNINSNGSVMVTSLTNLPISNSNELLLNIAISQENMGQIFNEKGGIDPGNWGSAPVLQAKIKGSIKINTNLKGTPMVFILDRKGEVVSQVEASLNNGILSIDFDEKRANNLYIIFK